MKKCISHDTEYDNNGLPVDYCYKVLNSDDDPTRCIYGGDESKCAFCKNDLLDTIIKLEDVLRASNTAWMLRYNPQMDTYTITISEVTNDDD